MTAVVAATQRSVTAVVVAVVVSLFLGLLVASLLRNRRSEAGRLAAGRGRTPPGAPAAPAVAARKFPGRPPPTVTRREFFRRSLVGSLLVFGAEFGGASLAFMWPNLTGGFGSLIAAGKVSDIKAFIQQTGQPFYNGPGRFYIVPYDGTGRDPATGADYVGEGVLDKAAGLMPLYQRCVHLGCRVPFCQQSEWFECPCHGSKYNKAGEYELGPAPRGMDRFPIAVSGDQVMVDTSTIVLGPPRGTNTIHEPPQGPFCVAPG